ncbi:hypothetical protein [Nostoc sp. JL34]|uniref:hypothetical protein n=2 Tax=Nostoc TaxID=1177 RepID=UPI0025F53ABD|nr:hypothetical protein [Nostoc sp. JL34]
MSVEQAMLNYRDEWTAKGGFISRYFGNIPVLNPLQHEIIRLLWLSPHIYNNLVDNSF